MQNLQTLSIGKHFEFIEDKEGNLSFEEIRTGNLQWEKAKNNNANFGLSASYYWIRFTIFNPNLEVARPILELGFARQDYIEFYNLKNGKYEIQITGDTFPFKQREIEDAHFAFELEIKPNTRQNYFIKTRSINNLSFLNPSLHKSFYFFHKETSFRDLSNGILYGFLFIMVFYNLFLFFIVKERVYLYLSCYVFTFDYVLGSLHGVTFQYLYPDNPWLANKDIFLSLPLVITFQILLANGYLELKTNLPKVYFFLRVYIAIIVLYAILINSILSNEINFTYHSIYFFIFFNSVLFIALGIYLSLKKFRPAYFYLISWSILLVSLIIRALAGASIIMLNAFTFWSFQFGLAVMLIFISIGLADKINYLKRKLQTTNAQLEDYSEYLEEKIAERTEELQSSLDTVNKLKTQQDGDYFLTSLLLEPFITNKSTSDKVKVDFLLIQKKKFEFYGREHHIGGDLCHTQTLNLNGQNYILFFNSDSMGKSLQGAGGAIVFGSVFFSIIERTKASIYSKDISPERWLKNAFVELHRVFLTFDCTMLVSAIIGLVEENTGLLYYINAEHPWIALYADKVCNFIEKEIHFTKLGSPVDSNKVFVNLYQMKKDDQLFIGSDGRDDIALNTAPDDFTLNQDEKEFLKAVTQADGDLQGIYEITSQKGRIIDDYSLIRIQYTTAENSDSTYLKNLSLTHYNSQNFEGALEHGLNYITQNPIDTEFLFFLGTIYKLEKNLKQAVTYFERVRLRNPYKFENLLELTELHVSLGNFGRAKKILNECTSINPSNSKLLKIRQYLQGLGESKPEMNSIK